MNDGLKLSYDDFTFDDALKVARKLFKNAKKIITDDECERVFGRRMFNSILAELLPRCSHLGKATFSVAGEATEVLLASCWFVNNRHGDFGPYGPSGYQEWKVNVEDNTVDGERYPLVIVFRRTFSNRSACLAESCSVARQYVAIALTENFLENYFFKELKPGWWCDYCQYVCNVRQLSRFMEANEFRNYFNVQAYVNSILLYH